MKNIKLFLVIVIGLTIQTAAQTAKVPEWAKSAVWYQIFPERFNNGDKSNDPKAEDTDGFKYGNIPEGWQTHPWTSDWYKLQPWEKASGRDFYGNVSNRRYGGDLQGIINKLDYLKSLGITAIYICPIFQSPSLHKYDGATYHHIDGNFGPDPAGDKKIIAGEDPSNPSTWKWTSADKLFLKLIKECHSRGMKIIIDGVFNHVGTTFWAFNDVVKNQQNSKFKDWFFIKSWDDPKTEKNEFDYEGWYGIKSLPRLKQDENGIVSGPKEYIHSAIKRWLSPNGKTADGIDGWRLDVAEQVNHKFWKAFRTWVKEVNPQAYIVGEIWWDEWPKNKMMDATPWLQGDEFDAVMNYRFARALKEFVIDQKKQIDSKALADSLNRLYTLYPKENNYVMMDLLDSHDVERVASMIVNPDIWYDHDGAPKDNKNYNVSKPSDKERMKQKLIVGIQFTLPGAPQIYYGDEVGMWGGDDPDCRKPMVWKEFKYETETTHPFGYKREPDEVKFNQDLFNWYSKMAKLRKSEITLSLGDVKFIDYSDDKMVLLFTREYKGNKLLIIVNNNPTEKNISLSKSGFLTGKKSVVDLVGNKKVELLNKSEIKLNPLQIVVLRENK